MADGAEQQDPRGRGAPERRAARRISILMLAREHGGPNTPSRSLASQGYAVHPAGTAAEAHRLLAQHKDAGIAVLDLSQDGVRGTEVYASLVRSLPAEREMLAIFLARSPSVNEVVRALRLGAVDVLRSPIEAAYLLDAVGRAETTLMRNQVLRHGARELGSLMRDLNLRAAAFSEAVQVSPPAAAARAPGLDFAEPLDPSAQREDTSSLAFTQRQMRMVTTAIKAQSLRRTILGSCLGDDPCWDMLLDLHQKALSGQVVSVTSLCRVSVAPATTALRRLEDLVEAGLVLRRRDADDARRVLVQLTETGVQKLRSYFVAISAGG